MSSLSIDQFEFFQKEPEIRAIFKSYLHKTLEPVWKKIPLALTHPHLFPLVWVDSNEESNSQINFYCLGPFQNRFFKFFYEYCLKICEPEQVDPFSVSSADFTIPWKNTAQRLTLCQICLNLTTPSLVKKMEKKIQKSSSYLKLGQMRVLPESILGEEKSSTEEEHRHKIYDILFQLDSKAPQEIRPFITLKFQQILASTPKHFFYERNPRHLVNLAVQMAYMHTKAQGSEKTFKRRAWVHHCSPLTLGFKRPQKLECWVVTLNFLKTNEILEERHFFQLFKYIVPNLQNLSFFTTFRDPESKLIHFYIEICSDHFDHKLRKRLHRFSSWISQEVLRRIERKPLAVFTARNEEESLKWLTTLSKELTSKNDIPQIALMFHNQSDDKLLFHLLIARPYFTGMLSLQQLLNSHLCEHQISYHFDKVKKLEGHRFQKELCLIEVAISKTPFLREDYCVNIQKARHLLVKTLQKILGPVRDFNGGLIAKQQDLFEALEQQVLSGPLLRHRVLFEDLFFNIQPSPLISNFTPSILLDWMNCLVKEKSQRQHSKQCERLLFEEKGEAAGIWLIDIPENLLDLIRQRINETIRHERETIWTCLRQSSPSIFGCLIKTRPDNHKFGLQQLKQLLPRNTFSKKTKLGTLE